MSRAPADDEREIRALARILDELDYYELLGLERAAPPTAVRVAYHTAQRRFHPDARRGAGAETRDAAERIARRIAEAYSVLRDARRRRLYDERNAEADGAARMPLVQADAEVGRRAVQERSGRTPNGRRYFALASADLQRGDLAAAIRNLQTALTFEPDNAFFREQLAAARGRAA